MSRGLPQLRPEHTFVAGQVVLCLLILYAPFQLWSTVTRSLLVNQDEWGRDSENAKKTVEGIQGMMSTDAWRASAENYVGSSVSGMAESLDALGLCGLKKSETLQRTRENADMATEVARSVLCAASAGLSRVGERWKSSPTKSSRSWAMAQTVGRIPTGLGPGISGGDSGVGDDWVEKERMQRQQLKQWRFDMAEKEWESRKIEGADIEGRNGDDDSFVGTNARNLPCSGVGVLVTDEGNDVCVCPITRTGSRCSMYRAVLCNVTLVEPEKECVIYSSADRENLLERDASCIKRRKTDTVNLGYKFFCTFAEDPVPDRRNLITERGIEFNYYANRSDEFATESSSDYSLLYRPFNFFHLTNQSHSISVSDFTQEQIIGEEPVPIQVGLDTYDAEYFAGGRFYFEGKPGSSKVRLRSINSREFIDITDAGPVFPRDMPGVNITQILSIVFGVTGAVVGTVFLYLKIWRAKPPQKPASR